MKDRTAQEEIVRTANLPEWTIVRPTELSKDDSSKIRVLLNLDQKVEPTTISRKDVGRFLASLVTYDFKAITITNDD